MTRRPVRLLTVLALLAGMVLAGAGPAGGRPATVADDRSEAAVASETATLPAPVVQRLRAAVSSKLEHEAIPGAVVGVWVPRHGYWVAAFGTADLTPPAPVPMSKGLTFRVASVTKTFVATAVLQLRDRGRLKLGDHLSRWITDFPDADRITVRQLLNHTSGAYPYFEDPTFLAAVETDPLRVWTADELLDVARRHDPQFAPGTSWHYSDTGYILLQKIVERITGKPLDEVIRRRVLEPLRLRRTAFPTTPSLAAPYAHGYWLPDPAGDLADITSIDPSMAMAAGAMTSTLADLKVWSRAVARGTLLSERSHRAQLTWVTISPQTTDTYGLGVFRRHGGGVGHSGQIFGYNCAVYTFPADGSTIVVLFNRCEMTGSPAEALAGWLRQIVVAST